MARIVQKFGGTSVANIERIRATAAIVRRAVAAGDQVAVVVSAMAGTTNQLVEWTRAVAMLHDAREYDVVVASGEQITAGLIALALQDHGIAARSWLGWQLPIQTDSTHGKARIQHIDTAEIERRMAQGEVPVIAGFQGLGERNRITTLGRGGSDATAVALAAALKADRCDIYTDVDGVYTTDPRIVAKARKLDKIAYEEMLEMASQGAKVLQIRSVEFASKYQVNLRVLSSFEEGQGTLITTEENIMEQALISGVTLNRDEAQVTVVGVPDRPGVASGILGPVADANIEVDMIVQNTGADGTTDFTFTVHRNDHDRTLEILQQVAADMGARGVRGEKKIVKISIVGVGMRSHAGIASRMFRALAAEGINIRMISTSEIKISVVVDEKYSELGVRTLHSEFGLENVPA